MKCFIVLVAVLQATLASVSVQMPYLNPAGVTYVNGPAAAPLAAPFAPVSSAYSTSTYYGNGHFFGRLAAHQVATHQVAAPVFAHHVAPSAAVVPTVHHVPAVADVPVTRIQAQHGYIQKEVDVAHPAVKTNRFELRRPAIQKQFYDIEERVIVRPAGSALVELDQPHTKVHKSSVVSPLAPAHFAPAHFAPSVISASPAPPTLVSPAPPSFIPGPGFGISSTPSPIDQGISSDDDSVVIEARRLSQPQIQQYQQEEQIQPQIQQYQQQQQTQPQIQQYQQQQAQSQVQQYQQQIQPQIQQYQQQQAQSQVQQYQQQQQIQPQIQQYQQQQQIQGQEQQLTQEYQTRSRVAQQPIQRTSLPLPSPPQIAQHQPQPQLRSQFQPQLETQTVVRSRPEVRLQDQSGNQQRLIELLTAREGVADVGFGSPSFRNIGDAGNVRARVLSAELAPRDAPVTGERVNTRRVVVSRPIETVEEVDVLEPVTKLQRVAVQHPALFKTAHVGYERVPTSVPVLGKAIAPAIAPVTYSQAPLYYH